MRPAVAPVLLSALLAAAASAQAQVTGPRAVSPRGLVVQESAVGAGGGRTAVLMAGHRGAGRHARFSVLARVGQDERLGRVQRLGQNGSAPQATVGQDGTALAAWTEHARGRTQVLRVSVAARGRGFGRVRTLVRAPTVTLGGIGVTASGRAVVAWRRGPHDALVQAAVARRGHRFGSAVTLGTSRNHAPSVAVAPSASVVVSWLDTPSPPLPPPAPAPASTTAHVLATTLAETAPTFAPVSELGALSFWSARPGAAAGIGGAAITWPQESGRRIVQLGLTGGFAPAVRLPAIRSAGYGLNSGPPALGIEADGTNVALWTDMQTLTAESETLRSSVVYSSVRLPGGAFLPWVARSAAGWLAGPPQAVSLPDRTVAAWAETAAGKPNRVMLVERSAVGDWRTLRVVPARRANADTLHAAVSAHYAAVGWIQDRARQGSGGRLVLVTYRP